MSPSPLVRIARQGSNLRRLLIRRLPEKFGPAMLTSKGGKYIMAKKRKKAKGWIRRRPRNVYVVCSTQEGKALKMLGIGRTITLSNILAVIKPPKYRV